MIDGCGREIDHLRLSLTDHCNLACRYCVPHGVPPTGRMIDGDFAFSLVRWLSSQHGIRHVRLTGGEPLLYPKLIPLLERIHGLGTLHQITLTTNAQALSHRAEALALAGLSRINISLDTLKPDRFTEIAHGGRLGDTIEGIEAAIAAGLTPVKINVVVQRGLNDDELPEIAAWGLSLGCIVRFLEVMPIGPLAHAIEQHLVPASEILKRLGTRFSLRPIPASLGQPATDYAAEGQGLRGVIGLIGSETRPFCDRCRRMRITSRGAIVACVHDPAQFDLSACWDGRHLDTRSADKILRTAVENKAAEGPRTQSLTMLTLGG